MSIPRRTFIQGTVLNGLAALLLPPAVLAEWPKAAFESKTPEEAIKALFEASELTASDKIIVKAPDIAENGSVVPVEVDASGLEAAIDSITVIVDKNPIPLVAQFNLTALSVPSISTRIKMAGTSDVTAIVKAGEQVFFAKKEVKVTIGGCGG